MPRLWPTLALLGSLSAAPAMAADATKPHPHQGVVSKYSGAPPKIDLSEAEKAELVAGKSVMKTIKTDTGGRGVAVQDIKATPEQIWAQILNFGAYPRVVDNVKVCETYEKADDHIRTRFVIGAMMIEVEYFVDHVVNTDAGWMTWTLDYSRESDLDDSVGFWRVEALPDRPGMSRVFYSVDVRIKGWVPAAIENMIAKSGLTKATAWVKRESEK